MHSTKTKLILFSLIGVLNTVVDIAVYIILLNTTHSFIIANIAATSVALSGSYLLNSRVTFSSKQWRLRTLILFVVVTVFGLWILQTGVIYLLNNLLGRIPFGIWQHTGRLQSLLRQLTPKLGATVVTFIWNYCWYNRVIFRGQSRRESAALAGTDL